MKGFIGNLVMMLALAGCNIMGSGSKYDSSIVPLKNKWEHAVPQQRIPKGLVSISAKSCGHCHVKQYEEWQYSTHAHAWTDLQFQAELRKKTSPFMCVNCHIPLQNQQDSIVKGTIDGDIYHPVKELNPGFDSLLRKEGITCVVCHLREHSIVGTRGLQGAPHRVLKDPQFLSEQLCISCHNAVAVVTPTLACSFETGEEWKAGPFYGVKNCIDCHMDTLSRPLVPNYKPRISHHHYFRASGIPKRKGAKTKVFNGLSFNLEEEFGRPSDDDSVRFILCVENSRAGHKVPTGDPERFIRIKSIITKGEKDTVFSKSYRIGEHWQWHPKALKLSDNNMMPGEGRAYKFAFRPLRDAEYKIRFIVEKYRISEEAAKYNKLREEYPRFITIYDTSLVWSARRAR